MTKKKIVIIGAGISGLSLGWFLKQRFGNKIELSILEKENRSGGWIRSFRQQGFLFEVGPRSCRTKGTGVKTLQLLEALGLENEVIPVAEVAKYRYLYSHKKLQRLPHHLISFFTSPLTKALPLALIKEIFKSKSLKEETIAEFITRRLSRDIAETLIDPMTSGIYAGDINQLSLQACFPKLYELEQKHGSLLKGLIRNIFYRAKTSHYSSFVKKALESPIFSLRQGMEQLVVTLSTQLQNELQLNAPVIEIKTKQEGMELVLNDGRAITADTVFLTLPAQSIGGLFNNQTEIVKKSTFVKATSVAVINFGWKSDVLESRGYEGFGYLISSKEKEDLLGVVWDSSVFPQQNEAKEETRLTAMMGGAHRQDLLALSEENLIAIALKSLAEHLGIREKPDVIRVTKAWQAIPQYELGHQQKTLELENDFSKFSCGKIHLVGSSWRGVSVNDCIAEAQKMAENFILR